ncbi:Hypothetical predicted protein [Octopus vulgaris]|uniref:Uncharacterized protein n=1 Tax=Octopus vulgaris TaxID=6645 RepID=A0AA36FCM6_OCTVU|nr:Hypothetical predicted protein [Octopus vulgaris]
MNCKFYIEFLSRHDRRRWSRCEVEKLGLRLSSAAQQLVEVSPIVGSRRLQNITSHILVPARVDSGAVVVAAGVGVAVVVVVGGAAGAGAGVAIVLSGVEAAGVVAGDGGGGGGDRTGSVVSATTTTTTIVANKPGIVDVGEVIGKVRGGGGGDSAAVAVIVSDDAIRCGGRGDGGCVTGSLLMSTAVIVSSESRDVAIYSYKNQTLSSPLR